VITDPEQVLPRQWMLEGDVIVLRGNDMVPQLPPEVLFAHDIENGMCIVNTETIESKRVADELPLRFHSIVTHVLVNNANNSAHVRMDSVPTDVFAQLEPIVHGKPAEQVFIQHATISGCLRNATKGLCPVSIASLFALSALRASTSVATS